MKRLRLPTHNPFCRLSFFGEKERELGAMGEKEKASVQEAITEDVYTAIVLLQHHRIKKGEEK